MTGARYNPDDVEFRNLIDMNNTLLEAFIDDDLITFIPLLRFLPMNNLRKLQKSLNFRDAFLHKILVQHKETFDPDNIRDFTDSLLKLLTEKELLEKSGIKEALTDNHLEMTINDIIFAGIETTVATLRWCIVYLISWPTYQEQIYNEIIKAVGSDRYPDLNDRSSLPFYQGFINEVLRFSSMAPVGIPHKTTEDTSIEGKNIPKDTQVLFNMWHFHHDERYWDDPNIFNPQRWMDEIRQFQLVITKVFCRFQPEEGYVLENRWQKQKCFLFLTRLIKDFKIIPNPDEPLPSIEAKSGLTGFLLNFSVLFKARKVNLEL